MKKIVWGLSLALVGLTTQVGAARFILTDEQEDETLLAIAIEEASRLDEEFAQAMEGMELGDFDPGGISFFSMDVEEVDEVLLPWAFDEIISDQMRSYVEKQSSCASPQPQPLLGKDVCDQGNPYQPTLEENRETPSYFDETAAVEPLTPTPHSEEHPHRRSKPRVSISREVEEAHLSDSVVHIDEVDDWTEENLEARERKKDWLKKKKRRSSAGRVVRRLR